MTSRPRLEFAGSIPHAYHRHLVPLIFEPYASDLAARVAAPESGAVLETACGTGALSRHLRAALPQSASLTATDLHAPMLDLARAKLGATEDIAWRVADATALPFADAAFDAVACQFGVMFFGDRAAGYREAARVLRPGGRFVFNVWDSLARNPFPRLVHETVAGLFPDDPPRFLELPFGYHDPTTIAAELRAAGFAGIRTTVLPKASHAPTPREVALAFATGTPLAAQIAQRRAVGSPDVIAAVERTIGAAFGPGPVSAPMQAILVEASRA